MSDTNDRPSDAELEELLGAYALDAVSDEERAQVEALLARSPRLRGEVDGHREIAALLAYSGADAPDSVWDGIQTTLDGAEDDRPAPLTMPIDLSSRRADRAERDEQGGWHGRRSTLLAAVGGAVAAMIVLVAGFVAFRGDTERSDVTTSIELAADLAFADAGARTAEFTVETEIDAPVEAALLPGGKGFLRADGLPDLSADRTYQLWGVSDGAVISLGVLGASPSVAVFEAGSAVTQLVVTEEHVGGVNRSSNPAVASAELS